MSERFYKIPRLTDKQINEYLLKLAEDLHHVSTNAQVFDGVIENVSFPNTTNYEWKNIIHQDSELIWHLNGSIGGIKFQYHRGGHKGEPHNKSSAFDEISIDGASVNTSNVASAAKILAQFKPLSFPKTNDGDEALEAQRAIQEATFARLQQLQEQMVKDTLELREKLDERITQKEAQLEEELAIRRDQIEKKLQTELEVLARQSDELDARRKAIDDSDNTHARRQIRERMLSDVQQRMQAFGVSEATAAKRRPVFRSMLALIGILLSLLGWTVYELSFPNNTTVTSIMAAAPSSESKSLSASSPSNSEASTHTNSTTPLASPTPSTSSSYAAWNSMPGERIALWIRLTLLSFGLAASLIYYIRWEKNWADQHAQSEFTLQQFHIDINRANWVIETCLEWSKEAQTPIPNALLESISRGLFVAKEPREHVLHPADELASALLGSSSKLTLNAGDNKIEIDKPGKIPKKTSLETT